MQGQQAGLFRSADRGIAIGPIMFVIALLGILATAIAAGSGSFTAGSNIETNRVKASALINIGENLKSGFERVNIMAAVEFNDVTINPNNTAAATDIFSPTGGGIIPPSISLASSASEIWYYPTGNFNGLGQSVNPDRLAVLKISADVCDAVNQKVINQNTPSAADVGNFKDTTLPNANFKDLWPSELKARLVGCVNNLNAATSGTYFYQVMGVR